MIKLDSNLVAKSIMDELKNIPDSEISKLLFDLGIPTKEHLAVTLTNEFLDAAKEEDFEPFLTKSNLRGRYVSGRLPEVLRDKITRSYLGTTDISVPKGLAEAAKNMTHSYDTYNSPSEVKKEDIIMTNAINNNREQELLEELRAIHAQKIGNQHIQELHDFVTAPKPLEASSPFVEMFKSVGSTVGRELKHAATAEISARINQQLIKMARQTFPQLPQGQMADTVLGFAIPTVLLLIASGFREMGDTQSMGISRQLIDGVETTAKAALGGVSRDAVRGVADAAVPMLGMVASLSAGAVQGQLDDGFSED